MATKTKRFNQYLTPLKSQPQLKPVVGFDCETHGLKNRFVCGVISTREADKLYLSAGEMLDALTDHNTMRGSRIYATKLGFDAFVLLQAVAGDRKIPAGWSLFDNGSKLIWVKKEIAKRDRSHRTTKGGGGKVERDYITLMDSLNVFPGGVELMGNVLQKVSKAYARHYAKTGEQESRRLAAYYDEKKLSAPGCRCAADNVEHESCKTFLGKLSWEKMSQAQRDELVTYCAADARTTRKFMEWFCEEIVKLGGDPKMTAASTAMDLFRRKYMRQEAIVIPQPHWTCLVESRESYYGGRTEDFVKGTVGPVWDYDVTSMYPSSMREISFPYPSPERFLKQDNPPDSCLEHEGFSLAKIRVPKMHIPPLPYRYGPKLLFPWGDIQGVWTHLEIRYALEVGCTLQEIQWSYFTEKSFNPFRGYVEDLFEKRLSYAYPADCDESECKHHKHGKLSAKCLSSMATEEVIKLFLNGLYGKFAQSFLTESEAKELGVTTKRGGGTFKRIEDATPEEIEYTGANHPEYMIEGYVINKAVPTLKAFMNPILSSYVTARARVKLHSFIMRCLRESVGVLYTDTDSLYTTKPLEWASEAKELGTLGVGKQWDRITILGPKSKMLVELGDKPKRHYTTKGVPLKSFKVEDPDTMLTTKRKPRAALFDSLEEGKATTQYVKFLGFKEAMARGKVPNEIVEMRKTFDPFEFPKRKILGNPSLQDILKRKFETEPWEIREGVLQDGAPATG